MSSEARLTIILTFISVIGIPTLGVCARIMGKWNNVQSQLTRVAQDMAKLVGDKDRVHLSIQQEIRDDRAATDRRLRWLEEHLWRKGE